MGLTIQPKRFGNKLAAFVAVAALVLQPAFSLVASQVANAVAGTVATDQSNLSSWDFSETRTKGHNALVNGGLHVWTDSNDSQSKAAGYYATPGLSLSDISSTSIEFVSYTGVRPSVQIGVDRDGNGTWDGYLVYEPWAYGDGQYWTNKTGFGVAAGGGYASMGTLAEYQAANPNAKVTSIGYSLGSGVQGDAVISKITIGDTAYTFGISQTPPATPANLRLNGNKACGYATNVNWITPTWNAVPDAVSYNYKVTLPGGATYGPVNVGNVTSVSGAFGGEGLSTFSVQTVDSNGLTSEWATPCAVTYDATAPAVPTLVSPANNATVNGASITQSWSDTSSDVDHYIYESYNNSAATSLRWHEEFAGTSKTATNVANGTTYWWRVKAVDHAGNVSPWSALWKIAVDNVAPGVPTLETPANNATITDNNFWFEWADVADAASYEVQFSQSNSTDSNGALNIGVWAGDASHNQPTESRAWSAGATGTWYWQVRAVDAAGNKSAWTVPWKLTIDPSTPSDNSGNNSGNTGSTPGDTTGNTTTNPTTNTGSTPAVAVETVAPQSFALQPAATPAQILAAAANGNSAVLGVETQNDNAKTSRTPAGDDGKVLGVTATPETKNGAFALAWYWWLAIAAVVIGAGWWIIAAVRRRDGDDV